MRDDEPDDYQETVSGAVLLWALFCIALWVGGAVLIYLEHGK